MSWKERLRRGFAFALALLMTAVVLQALPYRAEAAGPGAGDDGVLRIVALGDSLAAGYEQGLEKQPNPVPYGFVERVWEQALFRGYRAEFVNYGILGLKSEGLEKLLARVERGEGSGERDLLAEGQESLIDPRIADLVGDGGAVRANIAKADLILIQIGANDLSAYVALLASGETGEKADAFFRDLLDRLAASLEASIRTVHRINPDAVIVVGDQYSPVPEKILNQPVDYYGTLQDAVRTVTGKLGELSARFAEEGWDVRVAYSARRFIGHEPAMTTIVSLQGSDMHPTQSGYDAMGRAFTEAIWGDGYVTPSPRDPDVPITVFINGEELKPANAKPKLVNNYTYLVLRDIAAALGAERDLKWDGGTKSATFTLNGRTVVLTVDSNVMTVNGEPREIPAAPFVESGRTYVPLGALSDALGFDVVYRNTLKTAFING